MVLSTRPLFLSIGTLTVSMYLDAAHPPGKMKAAEVALGLDVDWSREGEEGPRRSLFKSYVHLRCDGWWWLGEVAMAVWESTTGGMRVEEVIRVCLQNVARGRRLGAAGGF